MEKYVSFLMMIFLAASGVFIVAFWRTKRPKVANDPCPPLPYVVYCHDFDIEGRGNEIVEKLEQIVPAGDSTWPIAGTNDWATAKTEARTIYEAQSSERKKLRHALNELARQMSLGDCAITFLLDQSGSMRGAPITQAAASLRSITECLSACKVTNEVLGFSTAGWLGGFARQKWIQDGRPAYPGRLCALLHVIYKSAENEAMPQLDWEAMVNPNLLRENVDGEALQWASSRLTALPQKRQFLIILSDGAPVDDSTLKENGPSILYWHLEKTIAAIKGDDNLQLAGFGIGHSLNGVYPITSECEHIADLLPRLSSLVLQLLSEGKAETLPHT